MFKVWNGLLFLLFACNTQASDEHIVDDKGLRGIVLRNRLIYLHNDMVGSLHSDQFKQKITPDERAEYCDQLRINGINQYNASCGQFIFNGEIFDLSNQRQKQRYDGVWQINPHHSYDVDKQAMSNLLWVRNGIRGKLYHIDTYLQSNNVCSQKQLADINEVEIRNKVFLVKIKRDCIAHCLGDDDDSDTEALVK